MSKNENQKYFWEKTCKKTKCDENAHITKIIIINLLLNFFMYFEKKDLDVFSVVNIWRH